MELIDERGNLFGVVNVVDALVVILLLAVVVAGIAVVTSSDDEPEPAGEPATRYATIGLGPQPNYVVDQLEEGDVATIDGSDDNLTVTDVYIRPVRDKPYVRIRAEVSGELVNNGGNQEFRVANAPLHLGDVVHLDMGAYAANGTVTDIGTDNSSLRVEERTTTVDVELRGVSPSIGNGLEEGMSETVRGETLATITSVESEPATVILESEDGNIYEREHPQNLTVTLRVDLRTRKTGFGTYFRGEQLRIGRTIILNFDSITVEGKITRMS